MGIRTLVVLTGVAAAPAICLLIAASGGSLRCHGTRIQLIERLIGPDRRVANECSVLI
jgi:hypothetical protein